MGSVQHGIFASIQKLRQRGYCFKPIFAALSALALLHPSFFAGDTSPRFCSQR